MNRRELKRLKVNEMYVMSPKSFLFKFGVMHLASNEKVTINDLNYILKENLLPASKEDITQEGIYRGDVILLGTVNKFYPFYNPLRQVELNLNQIEENTLIQLFDLYDKTGEDKYFNQIFDLVYPTQKEELLPTKEKIYCHKKFTRNRKDYKKAIDKNMQNDKI